MNMITMQALVLSGFGMGMVYLGIAFLNSLLYPQFFAGLYAFSENGLLRVIIAFPLFFGPANYLVGKAYDIAGPAIGGVGTVVFTVLWMTVMAIVVDQAKVNLWIVAGAMVAIMGCLMVVYGLKA
ncbi:MAG: hypothetical protein ACI9TY_001837 [Alphaproteobacteria bacterium]|jgi:hypothetical protein